MLKRPGRRVSATIAGEGPESAPLKAQAERLGSRRPGAASSATGRRARRSPWDACWSSRRAPSRCPMWSWKRPLPACRSSRPRSAAFRRYFGPQATPHPAGRRRRARRCDRRHARRSGATRRVARPCGRGCGRVLAATPWSMADWPRIEKRLRCENSRNSHNQFLNFVHYLAGASAGRYDGPAGTAVDRQEEQTQVANTCRSSPSREPASSFETPSAVAAAVTALPRADFAAAVARRPRRGPTSAPIRRSCSPARCG